MAHAHLVRAVCTHPVLSGNAYENIEKSNTEEIVVTDTIPLATNTQDQSIVGIQPV